MADSVFQTCFTQKHIFADVPPPVVRRQLLAAGFRFDGSAWTRTISTVCTLSPSEARHYIEQDAKDYQAAGMAG